MAEGQAVVLDNPIDPMSLVLRGQQQQAAGMFRQQQLGLQKQKADTAELNKTLAYKYEKPEDRFRQWGQNTVNKANDAVFSVYQSNPNADTIALKSQITKIQGDTQKELDYGIETAKLFNEKQKSLEAMKNILDHKEKERIMTSVISKDNPFEVDRDILENIEQVPGIYDLNAIVADSVTDIKDQYRKVSLGGIKTSPLGLFMEVQDNKMRFKDIDKTMDFLLRGDDITDIGLQQKINGGLISDRIRYDIARNEVASNGGDPQDVTQVMSRFKEIQYDPKYQPEVRKELRSILDQFNQEERDTKVQSMGKFHQESTTEELKKNRIMKRAENLNNILHPFDDKGNIRREAQENLPRILGGDFGGGKITKAAYEKGQYTTSKEWTQKISNDLNTYLSSPTDENKKQIQQTLQDSKNHLIQKTSHNIKLAIKTGTIFGQPEGVSGISDMKAQTDITDVNLDLSDPGVRSIVNALMNKNAGEAKVLLDDVDYMQKGDAKPSYLDDDNAQQDGFLDEEDDDGFLD